jgi:hypothetical protein
MRAVANEGDLQMGGSPKLLQGHRTVTMTSEVITMTIMDGNKDRPNYYRDRVTTDCRFVFTNSGPACTVLMGFPDQGERTADPDEGENPKTVMKTPPHTTFDSFRSYVEGKEVETKLIRAGEEGQYWHTKLVRFPAHSVLHIRDVYTQDVSFDTGAELNNRSAISDQIAYIFHTGASWHGKIGRTEIDVTFRIKKIPGPLRAISEKRANDESKGLKPESGNTHTKKPFSPNIVVWKGPCTPVVDGKTLRFVIKNWRPKPSNDLLLSFGFRPYP